MTTVIVSLGTADLAIGFDGGATLEMFNDPAGFEGWQISAADGSQVVAMGGGRLAIWDAGEPPAGAAP